MSLEEGCAEETYKAAEPLMSDANSSSSSNVFQIVTNADGTVSLVGLDPTQLEQLLNIQGDIDITRQLDIVFTFPIRHSQAKCNIVMMAVSICVCVSVCPSLYSHTTAQTWM